MVPEKTKAELELTDTPAVDPEMIAVNATAVAH